MMEPMDVVTVWLAIDPSTKVNGCMKVIPRTHGNGFSEYEDVDKQANVFPTEIKKHQRDDSKAVYLELAPNQATLHDGRLMHGSDANTSDVRRCGYTMRYISTRTKFNSEKFGQWHHCYLAHGVDRAGNVYGDPGRSYEHLARYRETHGRGGH
jgi:ectoine hydroxylase-related dioxygenase (phytanoyl-CoA dioxygenase family)